MKRVILTSLLLVLLLSQPGHIMGVENAPPVSSENSFEFYVLIGAGGFLLLGIILTFIKLLRNSTPKPEKAGEMDVFQVAQKASVASQSKMVPFLPFHIFPSEWFENVDSTKLRDFIEGTRNDAVNRFFKVLDNSSQKRQSQPPSPAIVQEAQRAMGSILNERMTSDVASGLFVKEKVARPEMRNFMEQSLNALLPGIKVPLPVVMDGGINVWTLCFLAGAGAFVGFAFGGCLAHWGMGIPSEAGMMFGGVFGAAAFMGAAMFIANNPWLRKAALVVTATVGVADTAFVLFKSKIKEMIPLPKFLVGRTDWTAYFMRIGFYTLVFVTILLIKKEKTYDQAQYREQIEGFVEQWIRSSLPIVAVLLVQGKDVSDPSPLQDRKLLFELIETTSSMRRPSDEERRKGVKNLIATFGRFGFRVPEGTVVGVDQETKLPIRRTFVWDESSAEKYDPLDAPIPGEVVEIRREYLEENGKIIKKGEVERKVD